MIQFIFNIGCLNNLNMFRPYLVFGLLLVILIVCSANDSMISKRLQKCLDYSTQIYKQAVPKCDSSPTNTDVISAQGFPYIAVLGYRNRDDEWLGWKCHGTLVSSRYVLTLGSCLRYPRASLTKVRLEVSTTEYSNEPTSFDYDIDEVIVHPLHNLNNRYNNVGLIKLSRNVNISINVRPICLPDNDIQSNNLFQVNYEASDLKNPPQRPLTENELNDVINEDRNGIRLPFNKKKIRNDIADELMYNRKSSNAYSCLGESGAPIYIGHPHASCSHIQLGIVSFGVGCDTKIPISATKVFSVADWIENIIWTDGEEF